MKKMLWEDAKKEINNGVVFLKFTTAWCGDCKMMEPITDELEKMMIGREIKFIEVDAEEAQLFRNAESDIQVLKVPSFFVIRNGVKKHLGYEYQPIELFIEELSR